MNIMLVSLWPKRTWKIGHEKRSYSWKNLDSIPHRITSSSWPWWKGGMTCMCLMRHSLPAGALKGPPVVSMSQWLSGIIFSAVSEIYHVFVVLPQQARHQKNWIGELFALWIRMNALHAISDVGDYEWMECDGKGEDRCFTFLFLNSRKGVFPRQKYYDKNRENNLGGSKWHWTYGNSNDNGCPSQKD